MTIEINFEEKDIEDFLSVKDNLRKYLGLEFIARQVNIQVNIFNFYIDILAYSKREKCFYIIELKKGELDSHAYTQVQKYKALMSLKYSFGLNKHKFKTLLIGQHLSEELIGTVSFYNNIDVMENPNKYLLFNYDFGEGISFLWRNNYEKDFAEKLEDFVNQQLKQGIKKAKSKLKIGEGINEEKSR